MSNRAEVPEAARPPIRADEHTTHALSSGPRAGLGRGGLWERWTAGPDERRERVGFYGCAKRFLCFSLIPPPHQGRGTSRGFLGALTATGKEVLFSGLVLVKI